MRVPFLIRRAVFNVLYRGVAMRRPADQFIGKGPYMLRWWLFGTSRTPDEHGNPKPRRPFGYSVYLHCFLRSDDDRAHPDHPWNWFSLLLFQGYSEHRKEDVSEYAEGNFRGANNIRVVDDRKHRDGPMTVVRDYLEGSIIRGRAEDAHRVVLHRQSYGYDGYGFAQTACGRPHSSKMTDLPWMSDVQASTVYQMWFKEQPVWSLFIAGKWRRRWGFHCEHGWKHWRDFDHDNGCGEPT